MAPIIFCPEWMPPRRCSTTVPTEVFARIKLHPVAACPRRWLVTVPGTNPQDVYGALGHLEKVRVPSSYLPLIITEADDEIITAETHDNGEERVRSSTERDSLYLRKQSIRSNVTKRAKLDAWTFAGFGLGSVKLGVKELKKERKKEKKSGKDEQISCERVVSQEKKRKASAQKKSPRSQGDDSENGKKDTRNDGNRDSIVAVPEGTSTSKPRNSSPSIQSIAQKMQDTCLNYMRWIPSQRSKKKKPRKKETRDSWYGYSGSLEVKRSYQKESMDLKWKHKSGCVGSVSTSSDGKASVSAKLPESIGDSGVDLSLGGPYNFRVVRHGAALRIAVSQTNERGRKRTKNLSMSTPSESNIRHEENMSTSDQRRDVDAGDDEVIRSSRKRWVTTFASSLDTRVALGGKCSLQLNPDGTHSVRVQAPSGGFEVSAARRVRDGNTSSQVQSQSGRSGSSSRSRTRHSPSRGAFPTLSARIGEEDGRCTSVMYTGGMRGRLSRTEVFRPVAPREQNISDRLPQPFRQHAESALVWLRAQPLVGRVGLFQEANREADVEPRTLTVTATLDSTEPSTVPVLTVSVGSNASWGNAAVRATSNGSAAANMEADLGKDVSLTATCAMSQPFGRPSISVRLDAWY